VSEENYVTKSLTVYVTHCPILLLGPPIQGESDKWNVQYSWEWTRISRTRRRKETTWKTQVQMADLCEETRYILSDSG
jgi:hypothetical protein